jgi:hypothetical protein
MIVNFQVPDAEARLLKEYCKQVSRTKSDVLREFVRSLASKIQEQGSTSA